MTTNNATKIHPGIQEILDAVEDVKVDTPSGRKYPGVVGVTAGEFYEEQPAEKLKKLADMRDEVVIGESTHVFGRFYDLQGNRRIGVERAVPRVVQMYPHAVQVFDDGVFISSGPYMAYEAVEVDGEPGVRLITMDKWRELAAEKRRQWIDAHPEVAAAQPAWADSAEVTEVDGDVVCIEYSFTRDSMWFSESAEWQDGAVTMKGYYLHVVGANDDVADAAEIRDLADAFTELAERIEQVEFTRWVETAQDAPLGTLKEVTP